MLVYVTSALDAVKLRLVNWVELRQADDTWFAMRKMEMIAVYFINTINGVTLILKCAPLFDRNALYVISI